MNLLVKEIKAEEQALKKDPDHKIDTENIINVTTTLSRAANTQAKLADMADHDKRLKNIEKLIEALPPGTLQELKAKMGN
jgi:hypothetical protein